MSATSPSHLPEQAGSAPRRPAHIIRSDAEAIEVAQRLAEDFAHGRRWNVTVTGACRGPSWSVFPTAACGPLPCRKAMAAPGCPTAP